MATNNTIGDFPYWVDYPTHVPMPQPVYQPVNPPPFQSYPVFLPQNNEPEYTKQLKRLMEYLNLPTLLQELLISAAHHPSDRSFWYVIADALEERGQLEDAEILRSKAKMVE